MKKTKKSVVRALMAVLLAFLIAIPQPEIAQAAILDSLDISGTIDEFKDAHDVAMTVYRRDDKGALVRVKPAKSSKKITLKPRNTYLVRLRTSEYYDGSHKVNATLKIWLSGKTIEGKTGSITALLVDKDDKNAYVGRLSFKASRNIVLNVVSGDHPLCAESDATGGKVAARDLWFWIYTSKPNDDAPAGIGLGETGRDTLREDWAKIKATFTVSKYRIVITS